MCGARPWRLPYMSKTRLGTDRLDKRRAGHPTGSGQAYPSKPIRLISPYPPGGGTDASARIVAQALSDQMGQQVEVDRRGGASGRIGTELAAKAPPDGRWINRYPQPRYSTTCNPVPARSLMYARPR